MIYAIGEDLVWDEDALELCEGGERVDAPRRVLKLLGYLVRNRTRVVMKEELIDAVWGRVVSDAALSQAVCKARRVVRDDGDSQHAIRTVHGIGFRFVGSLRPAALQEAQAIARPSAIEIESELLIGRDRELQVLGEHLARARQGQGQLLLIAGEPGIGKTTLVERFSARARADGAAVASGRNWEEGGAPAFWPWVQVLREMAERFGRATLERWMGTAARELLPLLDGGPAQTSEYTAKQVALDSSEERFRVFDSMVRMFQARAREAQSGDASSAACAPLLIVIEDLHAADEPSVQTLRFLCPELDRLRLLVVATFRDLEVTHPSALADLLGGPLHNTTRMTLETLTAEQTALLASRVVGRRVPERVSASLHEASAGNPFLITELLRLHGSQAIERLGDLSALSNFRIPERMANAVRRHVQLLPRATAQRLAIASVIGREFRLDLLSAVAESPSSLLLEELGPALRQHLLLPVPGSASTRLRFSHALVRDTLYGDLPVERRIELHLDVGAALELENVESPPLYELAHHFFLGVPGGSYDKAKEYVLKAAAHAQQLLAFDVAASLYDRAVELLDSAGNGDAMLRRVLIESGHAWYFAGQFEKALQRYERVCDLARAAGQAEEFAITVIWCVRVRKVMLLYDMRLQALVREALAMLPPGDSALRAMLVPISNVRWASFAPLPERARTNQESVDMARRVGDPKALLCTLVYQRWQACGTVVPEETLKICDEIVRLAREWDEPDIYADGLHSRLTERLTAADFQGAWADFNEFREFVDKRRLMGSLYYVKVIESSRAAVRGDMAQAERLSRDAFAWGQYVGDPVALLIHASQMWNIAYDRGAPSNVGKWIFDALPEDQSPRMRAVKMIMHLDFGEADQAARLFSDWARDRFAAVPQDWDELWILAALALACIATGGYLADELYQRLRPHRHLAIYSPGVLFYFGSGSRFLALLADSLGDVSAATEHFEHALDQAQRAAHVPRTARIQFEYGSMLLRCGNAERVKGHELLSAALRTARQFELVDLAEMVAREVAEHGAPQEFKKTRGRRQASR